MIRQITLLVIAMVLCSSGFSGGLEQANTNADSIHSNGKTALMMAAKKGDNAEVIRLLEKGAEPNRANNNGGTPIMYAALSGKVETVRLLLEQGVEVNASAKNGWSALMIAATKGYTDIVQALLSSGAKPNLPDVYLWTPLMRAVYEGRFQVARMLLDHEKIKVNQPGENGVTALHLAVLNGDPALVRLLLDKGADPQQTDKFGRTPSDLAKTRKNVQLQNLLQTPLS